MQRTISGNTEFSQKMRRNRKTKKDQLLGFTASNPLGLIFLSADNDSLSWIASSTFDRGKDDRKSKNLVT